MRGQGSRDAKTLTGLACSRVQRSSGTLCRTKATRGDGHLPWRESRSATRGALVLAARNNSPEVYVQLVTSA